MTAKLLKDIKMADGTILPAGTPVEKGARVDIIAQEDGYYIFVHTLDGRHQFGIKPAEISPETITFNVWVVIEPVYDLNTDDEETGEDLEAVTKLGIGNDPESVADILIAAGANDEDVNIAREAVAYHIEWINKPVSN